MHTIPTPEPQSDTTRGREQMTRVAAVPLVVMDPYLSVWSRSDRLTDTWPTHWTGRPQSMSGMARIDGVCHRFMGRTTRMAEPLPEMVQTSLDIGATRTIYGFEAAGIRLTLTFLTPMLPDDPALIARPVTYLTMSVAATDGQQHAVELYLDVSATWCVDQPETPVSWGRMQHGAVQSTWFRAEDQKPLRTGGDHVNIDWGYVHLSPSPARTATSAIGSALHVRNQFAAEGRLPNRDDLRDVRPITMPAPASGGVVGDPPGTPVDRPPLLVMAWSSDLGQVREWTEWSVAVSYDHVFAIEYFGRSIPPLWRSEFGSIGGLLSAAWAQQDDLTARAAAFDLTLDADLRRVGGSDYAQLGALAYRQCLGGHTLVADNDGSLIHVSKEMSSNGCVGTVDLTYPSAPFFLHFNPALLRAQLEPILRYAASPRWPFPFAPHDIGRYPLANGQVYGGGEIEDLNQMPYEECGNMLILVAALCRKQGDYGFARQYLEQLTQWANYLEGEGFDPGFQLCTDDFDGKAAHNANLSIKAIIAIRCYAEIAAALDNQEVAERLKELALDWRDAFLAAAENGGHLRANFDRPGGWSLKYNLVWDRWFGFDLFDEEMRLREVDLYLGSALTYGTPLHGDARYTKLDWLVWVACLGGLEGDLKRMLEPVGRWQRQTDARVPLSDWYDVTDGRQARGSGFWARPVVGGVFMPMIFEKA